MNKSLSAHSRLLPALTLALAFAAGSAAAATADATTGEQTKAHEASAQPVGDSWITTKVKADLLATDNVSGTDVKVETKNGIVMLTGSVATQAEHDKAVAVAKGIEGVKSVKSTGLKVVAAKK
jgi:hyperosmotically inducible protein